MSYPETTTMTTPYTFNLPSMDGLDFGNDDLADDMEGLTLSFPKVKIPAGGSLQFELPSQPRAIKRSSVASDKPSILSRCRYALRAFSGIDRSEVFTLITLYLLTGL